MGVGKIFSRGGQYWIFLGGTTLVKFHFTNLKLGEKQKIYRKMSTFKILRELVPLPPYPLWLHIILPVVATYRWVRQRGHVGFRRKTPALVILTTTSGECNWSDNMGSDTNKN